MKELLGAGPAPAAQPKTPSRPPKKRHLKAIFALFLATILLVGALVSVNAFGALSQTTAVHIDPATIDNSTLIIGSHLVHLSALTDSIYEIASQSVSASEQGSIYYKSELAGGAWFDITTASGIADISTTGSPVANSVIAGLWFTHHTRPNGITYNLLTGQPITIFDLPNPYDLRTMEELMPLDIQHKLVEDASQLQGQYKLDMMNGFWNTSVHNAITNEVDTTLGHLQGYLQHLATSGALARDKEAVQKVMSSYDALRRHEVMQILEAELLKLVKRASSDAFVTDSNTKAPTSRYSVDVALVGASNDSLSNVMSSKAQHAGKMMEQGSTLTSQLYYRYCNSLVSSAAVSDYATCNEHLSNIISLSNIMEDVLENAPKESALLMEALLPRSMDKYATQIRQGETAEYAAAKGAAEPEAVLNGMATTNADALNSFRLELQYLVDAYCMRIENAAALDYMSGLLQEGTGLYEVIPQDAFSAGAKASVDAYIDYLSTKQRELELAGGGNALDSTKTALNDLEQQRLSALDENDLAKAQALADEQTRLQAQMQAQMAEMARQMNELNARLVELSEQLKNATDAEKAALEAELAALRAKIDAMGKSVPSGSLLEVLQRLLADCKKILNNMQASEADLSSLSDYIDSLISMLDIDLPSAYAALQELLASLELSREARGDTSMNANIKKIEDALAKYRDAYYASLSGTLSGEEFEAICAAFFDGKLQGPDGSTLSNPTEQSNLTDDEKELVMLLAANMVVKENGNKDIRTWLSIRIQRDLLEGYPLLFETPRSTTEQYVATTALAKLIGMRYVWNGNVGRVTLSQGGKYYVFHGYTNEVELSEEQGGSTLMALPAVVQSGMYIPAAYAKDEFTVTTVYFEPIDSSPQCGVAANDALLAIAELLYASVLA